MLAIGVWVDMARVAVRECPAVLRPNWRVWYWILDFRVFWEFIAGAVVLPCISLLSGVLCLIVQVP